MHNLVWLAAAGTAVLLGGARPLLADAPTLGNAASFAVLAESGVRNTGVTTITGNLGVSAGSVSGAPTVELGRIFTNDALTREAQTDGAAAYRELSALPCTHDLTGQNLGGRTLGAGVYCIASPAELTGPLILDAKGSAEAVWVFRVAGTLTASPASSVLVAGGGFDGHVFWQVAGSATLGERSAFIGNILALDGISFGRGARLSGRALTQRGAVTLDGNRVSLCCSPLTITPGTLPDGKVGTLYSHTIRAAGGLAPYTFVHSSGELPGEVHVLPDGTIAGTPRAAGTFRFTVTARDARGCESSAAYEITIPSVPCPEITITSPPTVGSATVGVEYVLPPFDVTPLGTYTFTPVSILPVTRESPIYVTVTATDENGCTGTRTYPVDVDCPAIAIVAPAALPDGKEGVPYVLPEEAFDATPRGRGYTFTPAVIPNPTADLTSVTVTATDRYGCTGMRTYDLHICSAIAIVPKVLPAATVGLQYEAVIGATGGSDSYTFDIAGLPDDVDAVFPPAGTIRGVAMTAGEYTLTVTVTDNDTACTTTDTVTLPVVEAPPPECTTVVLLPSELANGTAGAEYEDELTATGGTEPHTFTRVTGSLPDDVELAADGTISGTATAAGAFTFEATARDAIGCTSNPRCYTIDVQPLSCPPGTDVELAPASLHFAFLGAPYLGTTIVADGGTGPYTFSVTSGDLPPGLTLVAATGAITGIPTTGGTYDFTITATDANGCLGSRCYTIHVGATIPALSQWWMVLLCAVLAGVALMTIGRIDA